VNDSMMIYPLSSDVSVSSVVVCLLILLISEILLDPVDKIFEIISKWGPHHGRHKLMFYCYTKDGDPKGKDDYASLSFMS
jgi:hypothetical protein